MATYTGTNQVYRQWAEKLAKAANLATDTFKCLLVTSSYTPDFTNHDELADITNEVTGSGYARQTLTNVTFVESGGTAKFVCDNIVFTASGGAITARRFVVYNDTVSGKPLVCSGLINNTDANVVVSDGNTLTLQIPAAGLFAISV